MASRRRHAVEEARLLPRAIAGVHAPLARRAGLRDALQPLALLLCRRRCFRRCVRLLVRLALRRPLLLGLGSGGPLVSLSGNPLPLGLAALAQRGGVLHRLAAFSAQVPLDAQVVLRQLGDLLVVPVLAEAARRPPRDHQPVRVVRAPLLDLQHRHTEAERVAEGEESVRGAGCAARAGVGTCPGGSQITGAPVSRRRHQLRG